MDRVYTIDEIKSIVAPIAAAHDVGRIYLFGSYARGEAMPNSDIDLRVDKGRLKGLFALGALYADLEDGLGKKLDLLTTGSLDQKFLQEISKEEVLIYASERAGYTDSQKIVKYCEEIEFAHNEYDRSYTAFCSNSTYRNAVALCLMQIGELTNKLSDEFKAAHTEIPWRAIRGMRNVVAHEYGNIDEETVWETAENGTLELKDFCLRFAAD